MRCGPPSKPQSSHHTQSHHPFFYSRCCRGDCHPSLCCSVPTGQYLTLQLSLNGAPDPILRSYTISDAPGGSVYRLTVKRLRGGQVSSYIYDHIKVGSTIEAAVSPNWSRVLLLMINTHHCYSSSSSSSSSSRGVNILLQYVVVNC